MRIPRWTCGTWNVKRPRTRPITVFGSVHRNPSTVSTTEGSVRAAAGRQERWERAGRDASRALVALDREPPLPGTTRSPAEACAARPAERGSLISSFAAQSMRFAPRGAGPFATDRRRVVLSFILHRHAGVPW